MSHEYHASYDNLYNARNDGANGSRNHVPMNYYEPNKKRGKSKWLTIGLPLLLLAIIVGAVLGGVLGSRAAKNVSSSSSTSGGSPSNNGGNGFGSGTNQGTGTNIGRFAVSTNAEFQMPVYPQTTNTAAFSQPTFSGSNTWPQDSFKPSNPQPATARIDHPRLIAPASKWQALPGLIAQDAYLSGWNASIFANASAYYSLPPVVYHLDGGSGILDNAREIKMRIKAFSYVYRMTNDSKWLDRTYAELQNAVSDNFGPSGSSKWNPVHFLDTAELTAAFGIAYDWLHYAWSSDQLNTIRSNIVTYGLSQGLQAYKSNQAWWSASDINGNWNCVCNSGLTLGALAILGDDTSGTPEQVIGLTVPNAASVCAKGPSTDGTWSETANYWYFGTTGHAEMASSLITATGSDYGLLTNNAGFNLTGLFHMYVTGATSLFNYGDHGPNKFSTTANSLLFYGSEYNQPIYTLFQRDQHDAPEPWSMFWYDPSVSGAFWDGQPLDHFFDDGLDQWASMRSTWTDNNALYAAIKAGKLQGHQTHNDLDCGDFVLDALGTRWAGELGSGDYLSAGYFSNDTQGSERWLYYRKRTEGQNAILVNAANQLVTAAPTVKHDTSGTVQGSSTVFSAPSDSNVYWYADLSSAYDSVTSFLRGMRLINGRKQVLLQDDINASQAIQWRMHTNASVSINGATATLTLDGQTMTVQIINGPSGVSFGQSQAVRLSTDPPTPEGSPDQPNPGVTVLTIDLPAGSYNLQVLFNPQWPGMQASDFKTPGFVPLNQWTLTSHN